MIARIRVPINVFFQIMRFALSESSANAGFELMDRGAACIFAKWTLFENGKNPSPPFPVRQQSNLKNDVPRTDPTRRHDSHHWPRKPNCPLQTVQCIVRSEV